MPADRRAAALLSRCRDAVLSQEPEPVLRRAVAVAELAGPRLNDRRNLDHRLVETQQVVLGPRACAVKVVAFFQDEPQEHEELLLVEHVPFRAGAFCQEPAKVVDHSGVLAEDALGEPELLLGVIGIGHSSAAMRAVMTAAGT